MQKLAIDRYYLAAHNVGAWVAWPYAICYRDQAIKLALFDADIPGITLPDAFPVTPDKAWKTSYFAFHLVPDLREALLNGREAFCLEWFLRRKTASPIAFSDENILEYVRLLRQNGALRAGLALYREVTRSAEQNRALALYFR